MSLPNDEMSVKLKNARRRHPDDLHHAGRGNPQAAGALIAEAVAQGADLVALPEYFPIMGRRDADKIAAREVDGSGPIQIFSPRPPASTASGWLVVRCRWSPVSKTRC